MKSSAPGVRHTVDFNHPSCSCQDFAQSKLPCKHFCAVFNHSQDFTFNSLPESYKSGPLLTIHTSQETTEADSSSQMQSSEIETDYSPCGTLPKRRSHSLAKLKHSIREAAEKAKGLAVYCTNEEKLEKAQWHLLEAQKLLAEGANTSGGIVVRGSPTKGCSGEKRGKLPRPSSFRLSAINKAKRTALEHWKSRGRVGRKADGIRKGLNVAPSL